MLAPCLGVPIAPGHGRVLLEGRAMLREFVIRRLGTEQGADEILRRAWARLEAMTLPLGTTSLTMLFTLAEREIQASEKAAPLPPAAVDQPAGERQPGAVDP